MTFTSVCTVGPLLVEVIVLYFQLAMYDFHQHFPLPTPQDVVTRDATHHLGDPHPSYHPRDERVAGSFKPSPLTSVMPSLNQDQGPLESTPASKEMHDGLLVTVTARGKFPGETENDTNLPNRVEMQTCPICNEHIVKDIGLGIDHIASCELEIWKDDGDDVTV